MSFNPLKQLKALRDDIELRGTEFALLCAMVLRTDNATGYVHYSIEGLAHDAGISDKTARSILQRPHVLRHFASVEGGRGRKTFRWHPRPVVVTGSEFGNPVREFGKTGERTGSSYRLSTYSSTYSSTRGSAESECGAVAPWSGMPCILPAGHDGGCRTLESSRVATG